ncbi:hypothetical protein PUR23_07075 [Methylorubrum populi]|jgi:hypothetical protein|uniref:hypothetical protein n=1 Tax=Methylorubrum populi TaxID=223967 RepID=UPI000AE169AE|nr:hypothetical protein [Methylorubrum populi]
MSSAMGKGRFAPREILGREKIGGFHRNRATKLVFKFPTVLSIDLQEPIGAI